MPISWSMFDRRADRDPRAAGKTGLAAFVADPEGNLVSLARA